MRIILNKSSSHTALANVFIHHGYYCSPVIQVLKIFVYSHKIRFKSQWSTTVVLFTRGEFNAPASNFGNVHPSDVLDMPVDPNEPTYCLCHQVSYGEMIGCDNTDVSLMHNSWLDTRRGNSNRKYMYVYNYLNLLYIITRQLNRDLYTFFLNQEMSPFLSLIERCKGLKA